MRLHGDEGRRPDLTGLFPLIQPGPEWSDLGAVTDQALRSGRPVFLIKPMAGMEVRYRLTDPDVIAACALMRGVLQRRLTRLGRLSAQEQVAGELIEIQ